jgi:hypothetical protein
MLGLSASPQLSMLLGLFVSQHDPACFTHTSPRGRTLILLHMDDMLITGNDFEYIAFVKACLSEQFQMSNLGPLSYFLGIEVTSTPDSHDLLDRAGLTDHFSGHSYGASHLSSCHRWCSS